MVGLSSIPNWLKVLLAEKFFNSCLVHESEKKNEKNSFCLDCCESLCTHCLSNHQYHHLLQIRRYVYQDVVRLDDAQKLMNCSFVQPYTSNSAKVVFLNARPISRKFKGSGNLCLVCDRNLQHPYLFCSVSCKVQHMISDKVSPRRHHCYECELELSFGPRWAWSGWSSSSDIWVLDCRTLACTEVVKKKRSAVSVSRTRHRLKCSTAAELVATVSRRKGVPCIDGWKCCLVFRI